MESKTDDTVVQNRKNQFNCQHYFLKNRCTISSNEGKTHLKINNMKKLIIVFFLCFCALTYGQDSMFSSIPLKNGKAFYSGIVQIDNVSKNELYNRAKRWFVNTYTSAQDNIQLDDKENGEIVGKGCFQTNWDIAIISSQNINVCQTIRILIKDNRYKYEITNFSVNYFANAGQTSGPAFFDMPLENWMSFSKKNSQKLFKKIDVHVNDVIKSLSEYLKMKPEEW